MLVSMTRGKLNRLSQGNIALKVRILVGNPAGLLIVKIGHNRR
jgi:hypothetical protein